MSFPALSDGDLHKIIDLLTALMGYCDLAMLAANRLQANLTPRTPRAYRDLLHDLERCKAATDDLLVLLKYLGFLRT